MVSQRPAGIFIKDNRVLLIHRINHGREYYVFPGGHTEIGETLEETFVREIKEETSFDVISYKEVFRILSVDKEHKETRENVFFLVTEYNGDLNLGGEEAEKMSTDKDNQYYLTWYGKEEFKKLNPVFPDGIVDFVLDNILK